MTNEVSLAYQRGTTELGLDAFGSMSGFHRYSWVEQIKDMTNDEIFLVHEAAGPDFMHSRMANFVTNSNESGLKTSQDLML